MNQISKILGLSPVQFRSQVPKHSQCGQFCPGFTAESIPPNSGDSGTSPEPVKDSFPDVISYMQYILEHLSGQVAVIFETQLIWSLRASEVLDIRHRDVFNTGLIHIRSKKGSNSRFISSRSILLLKNHRKEYSDHKVFLLSYTAYYNALRRVGFTFPGGGRKINNSVTHTFRKYFLNYIHLATGVSTDVLQSFSGHKTLTGLSYYLGKNHLSL